MQTYYQNHWPIQAFQWDGTWQQLRRELPPDIFSHFVDYFDYMVDIFASKVTYQPDRYVKVATSFCDAWPIYVPRKHAVTDLWARPLHPGDYVAICKTVNCYKVESPLANHNLCYYDDVNLKFYRPADFETHWHTQRS